MLRMRLGRPCRGRSRAMVWAAFQSVGSVETRAVREDDAAISAVGLAGSKVLATRFVYTMHRRPKIYGRALFHTVVEIFICPKNIVMEQINRVDVGRNRCVKN